MSLNGFNRVMRRQLVDMADWGSELAIVKELVELHGGNVGVKSDGIDKGTTFTVQLPIVAVYAEPEEERPRPPAALDENRPLPEEVSLLNVDVLVVDDEIDARNLVKRLLEMAEQRFRWRLPRQKRWSESSRDAQMYLFSTSECLEKTAILLSGGCELLRRYKRTLYQQ
jgi:hypothetical protein